MELGVQLYVERRVNYLSGKNVQVRENMWMEYIYYIALLQNPSKIEFPLTSNIADRREQILPWWDSNLDWKVVRTN